MPKTKPTLARRSFSIYRHQKIRAAAHGATLAYSLADLREMIDAHLDTKQCAYCMGELTLANFSVDHCTPLSRAGSWGWNNLCICCTACNQAKGSLTAREWMQLSDLLREKFPPEARRDVLRRLKAGGRLRGKT